MFSHRKENEITSKVVIVTPSLAVEYLSNQIKNRPLSALRVDKYAKDITNDRWMVTHQGLAFDYDGRLIDGQHRLNAIIKANKPVKMIASFNVDPSTFIVFDTGGNRKPSDIIALEGYASRVARMASASIVYCINYELGFAPSKGLPKSIGNANVAVINYFKNNIGIMASAEYIAGYPRRDTLVPDSVSCFIHYQIQKKYSERNDIANDFIRQLLTGDNLPAESVIAELRRQLMASRMGNHKLMLSIIVARTIIAFNYWNSGIELRDFRQALMKARAGNTTQIIK